MHRARRVELTPPRDCGDERSIRRYRMSGAAIAIARGPATPARCNDG